MTRHFRRVPRSNNKLGLVVKLPNNYFQQNANNPSSPRKKESFLSKKKKTQKHAVTDEIIGKTSSFTIGASETMNRKDIVQTTKP